jgi:hypothetical protein
MNAVPRLGLLVTREFKVMCTTCKDEMLPPSGRNSTATAGTEC